MELQTAKRFHNLTLEQVQALDRVLTEAFPIHGRGNFPTLQVRAKDIIRVVKERLAERDIRVKDVRLNGATASHVLVRDNGLGCRDLDIIFGVELPRQEDFQVIKEVVLGSLRDLLPCGVNRRKITCLTMKEAYVQKMVKVFNEHDRWSLISLSNNRAKSLGLRFVSSLRRQFEFSVDSFQIILDRVLESYWESDRKRGGGLAAKRDGEGETKERENAGVPQDAEESAEKGPAAAPAAGSEGPGQDRPVPALEKELPAAEVARVDGTYEAQLGLEPESVGLRQEGVEVDAAEDVHSGEDIVLCERGGEKGPFHPEEPSASRPSAFSTEACDALVTHPGLKLQSGEGRPRQASAAQTDQPAPLEVVGCEEVTHSKADSVALGAESTRNAPESGLEFSFPPPAKKTCSTSQDVVPDYCPAPKLQRKMSRKMLNKPEKWSLLTDLSDLTTQLFPPIEIPKPLQPKLPSVDGAPGQRSSQAAARADARGSSEAFAAAAHAPAHALQDAAASAGASAGAAGQAVKPKQPKKPPDAEVPPRAASRPRVEEQSRAPPDTAPEDCGRSPWAAAAAGGGASAITVEAECMYGDFQQALDHLRRRLIATHNPEEIRGGGLLRYSDLLVRNFRPASETQIKSLERYMCSRFFIDFPDVGEQQREVEAYLQCHFVGSEEAGKYDYLMTLRRVVDESTVCLMGHERRQTLNMITVLALRVLGEQNAIPNTAHVTCFYQPAPYVAEPIYSSYFVTPAPPPPPLVYHPYPLHVHVQTGLV
ncbi:uncharacterized protein LOC114870059 [Betta splendens]|uniref:polynucleotide adenylyltransferase n=1 Tax=Betta splendens TaxID=158456 RepID=A0A6P7PX08_BETSP|nr:uncharacterized protein LOC114870059 [Betta splendens]